MAIRLWVESLARHRMVVAAVLLVGTLVVAFIAFRSRPQYVATSTLLMVAEPVPQSNGNPASATKPVLVGDLPALVQSSAILSRSARDLHPRSTAAKIGASVRAKADGGSNVIGVSFTAPSAEAAIAGANAVALETVAYYREIATQRFDSLAADLREQIRAARARLAADDRALATAARRYPYVDIRDDGNSIFARLVALRRERESVAAAAAGSSAAARLSARVLADVEPLAKVEINERDPRFRSVRDQYARDVAELERTRARYAPSFPGLPELDSIVHNESAAVDRAKQVAGRTPLGASPVYAQVLVQVGRDRATAANDAAKLASLDAEIAATNAGIEEHAGVSVDVAAIRRDRDAQTAAYALLAARLAATLADRAEAAATGSLIVFDRASSARETPLSKSVIVAIALAVLVLWLAAGLPMLIEGYDRRFRTAGSVETLYGMPVIASVR